MWTMYHLHIYSNHMLFIMNSSVIYFRVMCYSYSMFIHDAHYMRLWCIGFKRHTLSYYSTFSPYVWVGDLFPRTWSTQSQCTSCIVPYYTLFFWEDNPWPKPLSAPLCSSLMTLWMRICSLNLFYVCITRSIYSYVYFLLFWECSPHPFFCSMYVASLFWDCIPRTWIYINAMCLVYSYLCLFSSICVMYHSKFNGLVHYVQCGDWQHAFHLNQACNLDIYSSCTEYMPLRHQPKMHVAFVLVNSTMSSKNNDSKTIAVNSLFDSSSFSHMQIWAKVLCLVLFVILINMHGLCVWRKSSACIVILRLISHTVV